MYGNVLARSNQIRTEQALQQMITTGIQQIGDMVSQASGTNNGSLAANAITNMWSSIGSPLPKFRR